MRTEVSSIGKSFRAMFRERRRFARRRVACAVGLPVGVSMPDERINPEGEEYPQPIMGYTRDLSESGLSLVLPTARLGEEDISAPGAPLRVVLCLPAGIVILHAVTVRSSDTLSEDHQPSQLIGTRIVKINDLNRRRLTDFLRELAAQDEN